MAWDGMKSRLGEHQFHDDEAMRPRLGRDGVKLDMSCPHCSAFSEVVFEWDDILALARGQSPPGFTRTTTGHEYSLICPRCEQHYITSKKDYMENPRMSADEAHEARLRRREVSMTRPVGMETVASWLAAARAHGFVR